ncbi:MAG: PAS domain S-box protein [Promethearchaeia archaeon]
MKNLDAEDCFSSKQYKTILQRSPLPTLVINQDLEIVFLNEEAKHSFFEDNKDPILNIQVLKLDIIKSNFRDKLKKIRDNGNLKSLPSLEAQIKTTKNRYEWFKINFSKFTIESSPFFQLTFTNIQDYKNTPQLISPSREFASIAEQSLIGICILQNDKVQYVNSKYAQMFGASKEEMLHLKAGEYLNYIHPDFRSESKNQARKKQQGKKGTKNNYIFKALKKDGTPFWAEIVSHTIEFNGDSADLIVLRNITEENWIKSQLREARKVVKSLSQQTIMGIFILQNDTFKYVNQKLVQMMGYPKQEILNWKPNVFYKKVIHPDDRQFIQEQAAKKQKGEKDVITHYEFKGIKKNGETYWAELYSNTITYQGKTAILGVGLDISEQKDAKRKLQKNETKFAHLINNMSDMLIELDEKLKIQFCSSQLYKMFGYSPDEIIGKRAYQFVHPEDLPCIVKKMKSIFKTKKDLTLEYRGHHKNGEWIPTYSKGSVYEYEGKRGLIFIARDNRKKKRAERKLRESEKKYRTLIENSPNAIYLVNLNSEIVDCNKLALKTFSKSRKEIIGHNIFQLLDFPEDKIRYILNELFDRIKHRSFKPIEIQFVNAKGAKKWLHLYYSLMKIGGKNLVLLETQDISNLKLAKSLLTKENIKLRELEEKNRKIIDVSPNSIILLDLNSKIIDFNDAAMENLNFSKREAVGKRVFEILDIPQKKVKRLLKTFVARLKKGSKKPIEINYRDYQGRNKWIEIYYNLVLINKNSRIIVESVDVTEKKRALKIIKEENKKLKHFDEIRTEFVKRASHELKTPLTSIHGALQLFLELYNSELDERGKEFIQIALKGSTRLKKLISSLLDISRLEENKLIPLKLKSYNFKEIIDDCINEIKYLAERRKTKIKLHCKEPIPKIKLDKIRFEQVITNLLSNALKNTPPHGNISINVVKRKGSLLLSVKDTGIGLTEKEKPRLFKKFSKIERYGKGHKVNTEGTGLGLFISKTIVKMHGGKIWAESEGRYKGSTFFIELPLENFED